MQIVKFLLTVLVQLVLSGLCEAHAQRQAPQAPTAPAGLMLGAHTTAALGTSIQPDADLPPLETANGMGAGVRVGYAFTSRLMAWVGADVAKQADRTFGGIGDFALSHLEAGARYSFPLRQPRLRPYVTASLARRALSTTVVDEESGEEVELGFSGIAFGAGVGLEYHLSPALAVDGGVGLNVGKFGTFAIEGRSTGVDVSSSTSTRLMAGLNWYP